VRCAAMGCAPSDQGERRCCTNGQANCPLLLRRELSGEEGEEACQQDVGEGAAGKLGPLASTDDLKATEQATGKYGSAPLAVVVGRPPPKPNSKTGSLQGRSGSLHDSAMGSVLFNSIGGIVKQLSQQLPKGFVEEVMKPSKSSAQELAGPPDRPDCKQGGSSGSRKQQRESDVSSPDSPMILVGSMGRRPSVSLQIVIESRRVIKDCYHIEDSEIGKGAFGSVFKSRVKATGASRAVKCIKKCLTKNNIGALKQEISILKMVDHQNISRLYELFEDEQTIYIVMELCNGGTLYDHLVKLRNFSEAQAAISLLQITRAVSYLHKTDICHRDIKPANVLVLTKDPVEKASLRLTDFGLSCHCSQGQVLNERVGTLAYMSPQVLNKNYGKSCDVWSAGVTLYLLLCGQVPFLGETDPETRTKICEGHIVFEPTLWVDVSEDGLNLVSKMICVSAARRIKAEDAINCAWMQKKVQEGTDPLPIQMGILQNLRGFRGLNKFKRAALQVIAGLLPEEQIRLCRETFISLDKDGDGMLTMQELLERLHTLSKVDDEEMRDMENYFRHCTTADRAPYSYTEFLAATFNRKQLCTKDVCAAAFRLFDKNGDGAISHQELSEGKVLGELSTEELKRLVQDFDANGDGTIDLQEFMEMMRDGEGWTPTHKAPRLRRPSTGSWDSKGSFSDASAMTARYSVEPGRSVKSLTSVGARSIPDANRKGVNKDNSSKSSGVGRALNFFSGRSKSAGLGVPKIPARW